MGGLESSDQSSHSELAGFGRGNHFVLVESSGLVVFVGSLVSVDDHESVSDVVGYLGAVGAVDGDLLVIDSETVTMGVRVGEESSLEHFVERGFDTWDEVGRREGRLLGFSEVILRVAVEYEFSDRDEWVVAMGPNLGYVEDVPSVLEAVLIGHDLRLESPSGGVSVFNMIKQVSGSIVGVCALQGVCLGSSKILDARVSLDVDLNPELLVLAIHPLESVRTVPVQVSVTIGSSSL